MKQSTMRKGFRVAPSILLAVLFSGLAGCMTNPTTGERRFNLMSMDQEIEMGREADGQITEAIGLYPDEGLQTYVSELGRSMGADSE